MEQAEPSTVPGLLDEVSDEEQLLLEQALAIAEHKFAERNGKSNDSKLPDITTSRKLPVLLQTVPSQVGGQQGSTSYGHLPEKTPARKMPTGLQKALPTPPQLLFPREGDLHYLYTTADVDLYSQRLLLTPGLLEIGMDIEWLVTYETGQAPRPTALIQLCVESPMRQVPVCLLLQVAHSGIPPSLRKLLTIPSLQKVGVGITGDAMKLMRDFGIKCGGIIELMEQAAQRLPARAAGMPTKWSLADLTLQLLGADLPKDEVVRCSNWEEVPLSQRQQEYAAADAYASLLVHKALKKLPRRAEC